MSRRAQSISLSLLGAALAVFAAACATEDTSLGQSSSELRSGSGSVAAVIAADSNYSTLLAAVEFAGLAGALSDPAAELTVLAPTNAAFEAALANLGLTAAELLTESNKDLVTQILLYHVIGSEAPRSAVVGLDGQAVTTLQGDEIDIDVVLRRFIRLNGSAVVVDADNFASNGVVHGIDRVLLPPSVFGSDGTLYDVLASDPSFSTLVAAIDFAGLESALSDPATDLTVLAPDNRAFDRLLAELGLSAADLLTESNKQLVTSILLYHVFAGELRSGDVRAAAGTAVPTLQGESVSVNVFLRRIILLNGDTLVRRADVDATNGVIHYVTQVLLPPSTGL